MSTGLRAPDPDGFVVGVDELDPDVAWTDGVLDEAADRGDLVSGRARLVAGLGEAAVLELPAGLEDLPALRGVAAWLGALGHDGDGPRPTAVGAFPFDRTAPARLVVPARALCRASDGRVWRISVTDRKGAQRRAPAPPRPRPAQARAATRLAEVPPGGDYARAVAAALEEIRLGGVHKVVLSRGLELGLAEPAVPSALLRTLWGSDPAFAPFSVRTGTGRLVGASPELIVGREGRRVVSHAFAGTAALTRGTSPDELLLRSPKELAEHRYVVEEIAAVLARRCVDLDVPRAPSVVQLRSDARLGTLLRGTLRDEAEQTALVLLAQLHPTPAVGGVPRDAALKAIGTLEARPRGYWAGVSGWVDARGDGEWVLTIRSAVLEGDGTLVRVRAGAGIVEGSSPEAELAETTVKLAPVLDALVPGASASLGHAARDAG